MIAVTFHYFSNHLAEPAIFNGDITSYALYLRYTIPCSQSTDQDICDYLECPLGESRCGTQCYTTSTHVCCDNILHLKANDHACCAGNYIERASPSDVCCGGSFYALQSQFSCCGGAYQAVAPGSVCCTEGDIATVGAGKAVLIHFERREYFDYKIIKLRLIG